MMIKNSPLAAAIAAAALLASSVAMAATVAKDPVSGELRAPTAEEAKALSQSAAQSKGKLTVLSQARGLLTGTVNPQAVVHANGMITQELDESTMSYSMASRNADGSIAQICVNGSDAADTVLNAKPAKSNAKGHHHVAK